jgi:hypothetical protein
MYSDRKTLMETLAMPKAGMFNRVRATAYIVLEVNFVQFQTSPEYRDLGRIMRTVKLNMIRVGNYGNLEPPPDAGCFPIMDILTRSGSDDPAKRVIDYHRGSVDPAKLGMFTCVGSSIDSTELGMFTFSAGSYTK